ncbi:hypothetical protein [Candidatus Pelagibacter sp. HIMB1495]|uniref:hypothetical protein n=1 Tax=unclassified Candidatus Pelagibacter TaxID=2647897 RepID=UPI003F86D8EC
MRKKGTKKVENNKTPLAIIFGAIVIASAIYISNPSEERKAYNRCLIDEEYSECSSSACRKMIREDCKEAIEYYLDR